MRCNAALRCAAGCGHALPYISDCAALTAASTVIPNFSYRVGPGADAPKRSTPMEIPLEPTYRSQPNVQAASTDTCKAENTSLRFNVTMSFWLTSSAQWPLKETEKPLAAHSDADTPNGARRGVLAALRCTPEGRKLLEGKVEWLKSSPWR